MGLLNYILNLYKGPIGESKIAFKLDMLDFFGHNGTCLRNLYIPRYDGSTTEIDLLYITKKGIFVIESKNYSGYIFGNDRAHNWTSTLYGGKTWYGKKLVNKYHFYNPVKQNYAHIKALQSYIGDFVAYSIIVFGNDSELMNISISSPGIYVCNTKSMNAVIKNLWNSVPDVYNDTQISELCSRLLPLTNIDNAVKATHIQEIKHGNTRLICPWCGGKLVLRTAKKGGYQGRQFYGCSNYPKCKFIKNIHEA